MAELKLLADRTLVDGAVLDSLQVHVRTHSWAASDPRARCLQQLVTAAPVEIRNSSTSGGLFFRLRTQSDAVTLLIFGVCFAQAQLQAFTIQASRLASIAAALHRNDTGAALQISASGSLPVGYTSNLHLLRAYAADLAVPLDYYEPELAPLEQDLSKKSMTEVSWQRMDAALSQLPSSGVVLELGGLGTGLALQKPAAIRVRRDEAVKSLSSFGFMGGLGSFEGETDGASEPPSLSMPSFSYVGTALGYAVHSSLAFPSVLALVHAYEHGLALLALLHVARVHFSAAALVRATGDSFLLNARERVLLAQQHRRARPWWAQLVDAAMDGTKAASGWVADRAHAVIASLQQLLQEKDDNPESLAVPAAPAPRLAEAASAESALPIFSEDETAWAVMRHMAGRGSHLAQLFVGVRLQRYVPVASPVKTHGSSPLLGSEEDDLMTAFGAAAVGDSPGGAFHFAVGDTRGRCQAAVDMLVPLAQDLVSDGALVSAPNPIDSYAPLWQLLEDGSLAAATAEEALNVAYLRQLAREGDPAAGAQLGELLMYGYPAGGLAVDQDAALHHLQEAAAAGEVEAGAQAGVLLMERALHVLEEVGHNARALPLFVPHRDEQLHAGAGSPTPANGSNASAVAAVIVGGSASVTGPAQDDQALASGSLPPAQVGGMSDPLPHNGGGVVGLDNAGISVVGGLGGAFDGARSSPAGDAPLLGSLDHSLSSGSVRTADALRNLTIARAYLEEASAAGSAQGTAGLGFLHMTGVPAAGIPRNLSLAVEYLKRAADAGFAPAHSNLAAIFLMPESELEDGVARNGSAARWHLERALEAGADFAPAACNRALIDYYGLDKEVPSEAKGGVGSDDDGGPDDEDEPGNCTAALTRWADIALRGRWLHESLFNFEAVERGFKYLASGGDTARSHQVVAADVEQTVVLQLLVLSALGVPRAQEGAAFMLRSPAMAGRLAPLLDAAAIAQRPLNDSAKQQSPAAFAAASDTAAVTDLFLPRPFRRRHRSPAPASAAAAATQLPTLPDRAKPSINASFQLAFQLARMAATSGSGYSCKIVGDCFMQPWASVAECLTGAEPLMQEPGAASLGLASAALWWYSRGASLGQAHAALAASQLLSSERAPLELRNLTRAWELQDETLSMDYLGWWPVTAARLQLAAISAWQVVRAAATRESFMEGRWSHSAWQAVQHAWECVVDAPRPPEHLAAAWEATEVADEEEGDVVAPRFLRSTSPSPNSSEPSRYMVGSLPLSLEDRLLCSVLARSCIVAAALAAACASAAVLAVAFCSGARGQVA